MGALWNMARGMGELLFAPFAWMPPLAGVITMSALLGVVLLLAFRAVTPQARLKRVKDLMSATIYEMRLYSAYPGHVLRAQGRAIILTVRYLLLALPSFVVLLPIVGVMLARAALVYEVMPLEVGERALVKVSHETDARGITELAVQANAQYLRILRPHVYLDGAVYVRVEAVKEGQTPIIVRHGKTSLEKTVNVGGGGGVSPVRVVAGTWETLLSQEDPLPAGGAIKSITVAYREEGLTWLGMPWWLHLLIISMAVALTLRRRLGVVF